MSRFSSLPAEQVEILYQNADRFYDEVGKEKFRTCAEVTPEAIRKYKNSDLN